MSALVTFKKSRRKLHIACGDVCSSYKKYTLRRRRTRKKLAASRRVLSAPCKRTA